MGKWHLSLEELPTGYTLDLCDLCSKFGFEDGEQFSDLCYTLEDVGAGKVDPEAFIRAVVRKWVLPSVGNPAVYEIGGIHNPIRHDIGSDLSSCPETHFEGKIEISTADLLTLARTMLVPGKDS